MKREFKVHSINIPPDWLDKAALVDSEIIVQLKLYKMIKLLFLENYVHFFNCL